MSGSEPSESLVSSLKIGRIFSLTSSALITASQVNTKLNAKSLAPELIAKTRKLSKGLERVQKDLELLRDFSAAEELSIDF